MKKTHQISLTPLTKEVQPEPDFLNCRKCNERKPKEAFRKANLWRSKVCIDCDYAIKKEKADKAREEKERYGYF
jgi:hypothetical protein